MAKNIFEKFEKKLKYENSPQKNKILGLIDACTRADLIFY